MAHQTAYLTLTLFLLVACTATNGASTRNKQISKVEKADHINLVVQSCANNRLVQQNQTMLSRGDVVLKQSDYTVNGSLYLCGDNTTVQVNGTLQAQRIYLIGKRARVQARRFILAAPINQSVFILEGSDAMIITTDQLVNPTILQAWNGRSPERYGIIGIAMNREFVRIKR